MSRALLTKTERLAVKGEIEDPNATSTYIARVKNRIENQLEEDVTLLRENRPDIFERLHETVCEDNSGDE